MEAGLCDLAPCQWELAARPQRRLSEPMPFYSSQQTASALKPSAPLWILHDSDAVYQAKRPILLDYTAQATM